MDTYVKILFFICIIVFFLLGCLAGWITNETKTEDEKISGYITLIKCEDGMEVNLKIDEVGDLFTMEKMTFIVLHPK